MMRVLAIFLLLAIVFVFSLRASPAPEKGPGGNILGFTLKLSDGTPKPLLDFKGKVLMLVNVASKCGFTGQYEDLEKLQKKYEAQGFTVLAFPANNFLGQEPGTNEEIITFCRTTYGVTFPVFEKISVAGDDQHPLYRFLTSDATNPGHSGKISWNFNKFLIDRNGNVIARYGSMTNPSSDEVVKAIEKALSEKAPEEKAE
ncbi:MAG: glutathione peroxidase [Candidatus Riflebacteria bacterium]